MQRSKLDEFEKREDTNATSPPKKLDKSGLMIKSIVAIGGLEKKNGERYENKPLIYKNHAIIGDNTPHSSDLLKRIIDQITALSLLTKKHHNIKRFTLLVTDEFSFYTSCAPLSFSDYLTIINGTCDALKDLPPNIILIISSLPVLWPDGTMRNAVLHGQSPNKSGSPPIIYHFSKESISQIDPYYAKHKLHKNKFNYQDCYDIYPDDYSNQYSPDIVLAGTPVTCNSKDQYKNVMVVRGYNLAPFIHIVDICLDLTNEIGLKNLEKFFSRLDFQNKEEVPVNVIYTISSNSIEKKNKTLIVPPIHADWKNKSVGDVTLKKEEIGPLHFGTYPSMVYVYHQMRVELISNDQFTLVAHHKLKRDKVHASQVLDNHKNTFLHQIFLSNKTSAVSCYQNHQIKNFLNIVGYFWGEAINQKNINGDTPLHLALKITDDKDILSMLLKHGARINIQNNQGETPLQLVANNPDLVAWLYEQTTMLPDTSMIEKKLSHAYTMQDTTLLDNIAADSSPSEIIVLLSVIDKLTNTQNLDIPNFRHWFYQNLLINELKRPLDKVNLEIFYFVLSRYPIMDFNTPNPSLTFAEQICIKAYQLQSSALLYRVISLLNYTKLNLDTILKNIQLYSTDSAIMSWLCLTIIKNEILHHKREGRVDIITSALTPFLDVKQPSGYANFTIDMFLINMAIRKRDLNLLDKIQFIFPSSWTATIVDPVMKKFIQFPGRKEWFYNSLIKNELKRNDKANLDIIRMAIPHCDLSHSSGINELTLEDQFLIQAYQSKRSEFLSLFHVDKFIKNSYSLNRIANKVSNVDDFLVWMDQILLENRLRTILLASLSTSSQSTFFSSKTTRKQNDKKYHLHPNKKKKL